MQPDNDKNNSNGLNINDNRINCHTLCVRLMMTNILFGRNQ